MLKLVTLQDQIRVCLLQGCICYPLVATLVVGRLTTAVAIFARCRGCISGFFHVPATNIATGYVLLFVPAHFGEPCPNPFAACKESHPFRSLVASLSLAVKLSRARTSTALGAIS